MKKIILVFLISIILIGCGVKNKPLIMYRLSDSFFDNKLTEMKANMICPQCGRKCGTLNTMDEEYWACDICFYGEVYGDETLNIEE